MFATEPFLQIEKGQLSSVFERHDLAVENDLRIEAAGVLGQLRELICHPAQIPRKDFRALRTAMELRPNAVELVFDINNRRSLEPRPDRFRTRLRTGEHALDRAEQ